MLTAEQMVVAHRANLETLIKLTTKALEGVERLVALNMQVTRAALNESRETVHATLAVKDMQGLLELQASLLQPIGAKAALYGQRVCDIASGMQGEITRIVDQKIANVHDHFAKAMEAGLPGAPAGADAAVKAIQAAIAATAGALADSQQAIQQAVDLTQVSLDEAAAEGPPAAAKKRGRAASAPRTTRRKPV